MGKKITISIPEPCHEDWNTMTPKAKGRFCDVCEKVVVDFTGKNDQFISSYIQKHDNLCGRFNSSQLNRPIDLSKRKYSFIPPLAAQFILPIAMLTMGSAYGQQHFTSNNAKDSNYVSLNIGSRTQQNTQDIKGVITTSNGQPLVGVRIAVLETKDHIQTDSKGQYRMQVQAGHTLIINYYGFWSEELTINQQQDVYNVVLTKDPTFMEEVVIYGQAYKKEKRFQGSAAEVLSNMVGCIPQQKSIIQSEISYSNSERKKDSLTTVTISGTISEHKSYPLPGVNVLIKGTAIGTQSDFDGNYSIDAQAGQTLVFSYIGFESQEIAISTIDNTLDIDLVMNQALLGEVIITGGISIQEENWDQEFTSITPSKYIPKETIKQQDANTTAFKRIQQERKKATRQKAREARKKNN